MISVILPARDEEAVIGAALGSLARQTERRFEVIVVDDGSTDATAAAAAAFGKKLPRLEIVQTPRLGLVAALERGLAAAGGTLIARMDADDLAHPERLNRQSACLEASPTVGLAACQAIYGGDPRHGRGLALFVEWTNGLLSHEQISLNRFVESPLIHPAVMFRRELVERFGGYRGGAFPEDYELWLRWLECGVQMVKLDEKLLTWGERDRRLTRSDPRYSVDAFCRVKAPYLARWLAEHNPFHPNIVVWGAGRVSRKRLRYLADEGVRVEAWVDIDPRKIGWTVDGVPVLAPGELPPPGRCFVLANVASRGARELISEALRAQGRKLGRDYLACA